jgi:ligand-binding SRPBCC domain-containing protein
METIRLVTWIDAPMERCFKLSLSVDLQVASMKPTEGRPVEGVTRGLLGPGETVMWSGRHFGMRFTHTSRIDAYRPPMYFRDSMVAGMFERFEHEHHFAVMNDGTRMRDEVRFSAPMGVLGRVAEKVLIRRYLVRLLKERNAAIKRVAESGEWRRFLAAETDRAGAPDRGDGMVQRSPLLG